MLRITLLLPPRLTIISGLDRKHKDDSQMCNPEHNKESGPKGRCPHMRAYGMRHRTEACIVVNTPTRTTKNNQK